MIDRGRALVGIAACAVVALCAGSLCAEAKKKPVRHDKATMSDPKLIHKVLPQYPEDAKKEGVQGTVILDAVIAEDGSVRETTVVEGEDARLVEAARTAVGQWRYEPVLDGDDHPLEVLFTVTLRFKLDDKK